MSEGLTIHAAAVRYRVTGSGTLRSTLYTLDAVRSSALANHTLAATAENEVTLLANFKSQRIQLKIETTGLNETFAFSKIVIFIRPTGVDLPR